MSGARIGAGELGGRRLQVASATRPSSAQLRGALASIWSDSIPGARVLDLFAGSGAVGLELLSRGAAHATFVDSDRGAVNALARNLELAGRARTRLLALDGRAALERLTRGRERFDLLFVDPPYEQPLGPELFAALAVVADPGARLAVERRARDPLADAVPWQALGSRRYGDAELHLFELA